MKFSYTNEQVNSIVYRRAKKGEFYLPDFIDYDKLMEWADNAFERYGQNDGFYRSCCEAENEKLKLKKNENNRCKI